MRKTIAAAAIAAMLLIFAGCSQPEPQQPEELEVTEVKMVPVIVEHEPEPEVSYEEEYYYEEEVYYYEPEVYYEPEPMDDGSVPNLKRDGRVYADGSEWTWYSQNALPGGGLTDLNSSGRTVSDEGYVVDGDGYIAIASPDESLPIGTEIDTPWGPGRIYDYNDGSSYDVYTDW